MLADGATRDFYGATGIKAFSLTRCLVVTVLARIFIDIGAFLVLR